MTSVLIPVLMFILAIGIVGYLFYYLHKENEEITTNAPLILNLSSHECDGKFLGSEVDSKVGAFGRRIITYRPLDVNLEGLSKKEVLEKTKERSVIVDQEQIVPIFKGELSNERDVVLILAQSPDDYSPALRNSIFGKAIMWATVEQNTEKVIKDILKESGQTKDELLKKINDGEITREYIQNVEGIVKDILRIKLTEEKSKGEKPVYNPGPSNVSGY